MSDPLPLRVVTGSPTDEETAAIAALFTRLLLEQDASALPLPAAPTRSGWERSIRPLRGPWPPDRDWRER